MPESLLEMAFGAEEAAEIRRRAAAEERRRRLLNEPAPLAYSFNAAAWAASADGPDAPPSRPRRETASQARLRKSGERLAQLVRRLAPWLRPIVLEWIVQPVAEMVNAIIDERSGDNQGGK
jgi:hypothetical protein